MNRASSYLPDGASADVFIGLGSNQGHRIAALQRAVNRLGGVHGIEVAAVSPVYEAEAHVWPGAEPQPDHLNAVVHVRTQRSPEALFSKLQCLEGEAGRIQNAPKWSPRPLDLDLLLFGDQSVEIVCGDADNLIVPHPRMAERRFVLRPLADLVHNLVVPGADGATVSDLLERCLDTKRVERTWLRLVDDPRPRP